MDLDKLKDIDELESSLHMINDKINKLQNKGKGVNTSDYVKQVTTKDILNTKKLLYDKTVGDYNTHRTIYNELKFMQWQINILTSGYVILLFTALFIILFKMG